MKPSSPIDNRMYYGDISESDDEDRENYPGVWPLKNLNQSIYVLACGTCYYPITFFAYVFDEIADITPNKTLAVVIPTRYLLRNVRVATTDVTKPWKNRVYCPNCRAPISFISNTICKTTEEKFREIEEYYKPGEQMVLLWRELLYVNTYRVTLSLFNAINHGIGN